MTRTRNGIDQRHAMTRSDASPRVFWRLWWLALAAVAVVMLAWGTAWWAWSNNGASQISVRSRSSLPLEQIPFDGKAAFKSLETLCAFGPRISGSEGMRKQQEYLTDLFTQLGGQVTLQSFDYRHPETGEGVRLANLIVQWHPERTERVLLCAHYDTRPYADRDPDRAKRRSPFVSANDGTSGVAVLTELGRHMPGLEGPIGVDFVFFDAEEFVIDDFRDPYFVGSEYFAREYASRPPGYRYRAAVVLDMVGESTLRLPQEGHSMSWRDSRPLVNHIWRVARRLGVREFVPRVGQSVRDDHLALHNIAKIPSCDLIDFEYKYWHTTHDTPDKCDPLSLARVGWVLLEWLREVAAEPQSR